MVYRRLMRRTRDLKITSFSEYCRLIGSEGNQELPNFINAITTNLTSFYRESHHFDYLKDQFIPQHLRDLSSGNRLRIWSSACSTGEEPYSLAITVRQAMKNYLQQWDVKILATDLDTEVLETARQGVYKEDRIKDIPVDIQKRWFNKGSNGQSGMVKVKQELQALITFKQLNLLNDWPMRGPFDVILCRNVLIYFDKQTQLELLGRFVELLRPGGVIMLGHSESIAKSFSNLQPKGKTIYVKQGVHH
jgi:chemotaxis protein methyltransferase CheR